MGCPYCAAGFTLVEGECVALTQTVNPLFTPSCGDGTTTTIAGTNTPCQAHENCATCPQDCGTCSTETLNVLSVGDSDSDGVKDDTDYCTETPGTAGLTYTDGYVLPNGCFAGDIASAGSSQRPDGCLDQVDISILNDIIVNQGACTASPYGISTAACTSASNQNDCDSDGIVNEQDYCPMTPGLQGLIFADGYVLSNGCLAGDIASAGNFHQPDGCLDQTDISILNDIIVNQGECTPLR